MKLLKYEFVQPTFEKFETSRKEFMSNKRKIVNLTFVALREKEDEMIEMIKPHHQTLKSLKYNSTLNFLDQNKIMKVLANTNNLERFTLLCHFSVPYDGDVISLKRLKYLNFIMLSVKCNFFQTISAPNIVSLDLWCAVDGFASFLATLDKLKNLIIVSIRRRMPEVLSNDLSAGRYQLTKLELNQHMIIDSSSVCSPQAEANLIKFVHLRGSSLQDLTLIFDLTPKIVKFALTQLKSLKRFVVKIPKIPFCYEFFKDFAPSKSIVELTMFPPKADSDFEQLQEILRAFTHIDEWNRIVKKYKQSFEYFVVVGNDAQKIDYRTFKSYLTVVYQNIHPTST